jgi:hypothetical protein
LRVIKALRMLRLVKLVKISRSSLLMHVRRPVAADGYLHACVQA